MIYPNPTVPRSPPLPALYAVLGVHHAFRRGLAYNLARPICPPPPRTPGLNLCMFRVAHVVFLGGQPL